jgi:hypothetical protein
MSSSKRSSTTACAGAPAIVVIPRLKTTAERLNLFIAISNREKLQRITFLEK